ncbi:S8 family serine peptidase [Paractinoplanes hotanensis]|uniref:S8 family serine peptidase n=1 Tax=Paractinoplanes hotanensis TaxID=2906497 RepID=A0ABT0XXU5_9ACTN|nr:S8 family serine peptidase [Actinoplanes hotanensis]MCM4078537.1 S8 family serine peptidase [Actinoplanes hotanensis]
MSRLFRTDHTAMRMRTLATAAATAAVVLVGTAVPVQASLPEGTVFGTGLPGAIPGRYIVTLDEPAGGDVSALSVDGGATYVADLSATQARRLAADPDVRFVEQDRILILQATQNNPAWGLDRIDQRVTKASKTFTPTDDGDSVHAYVLDTGIRVTHADFRGRASYGYDALSGTSNADDCNGHGTHVAGTIGGQYFGVAKKVKLVAVRVLDCKGRGSLSQVIAGVNWVTTHAVKPAVANMSMGGSKSASLNAAVQRSINSGVTYVVAAGNENANASTMSPANLPAAITVGATDAADRRATFSNYGTALDLFAPGVNIRSDYYGGDNLTAVASGTSMAAPHVAGAAALVLDASPGLSPAQVRNLLVKNATGSKVKNARGSANRLLFVPRPPAKAVITSASLTVTAGQAYAGRLTLTAARRGTWSIAAGKLPTGLTLRPNGSITGTPTGPGSAAVTVRFTDYVPQAVTRSIKVTVRTTTPVIATTSLPAAAVGDYYYQQLTVAGGRAGTWSVVSGALPDGLTLPAGGTLEGTPATAGIAVFTVAFTDSFGVRSTRALTIDVS